MVTRTHLEIFRRGSTTYFTSTLFFPKAVRDDVFVLYSFVRTADDFVDAVPQQADAFYAFCDAYRNALSGEPAGDVVIDRFVDLVHRIGIDRAWVEAFLFSMASDLSRSSYATMAELDVYLYGSSEVIGLMMAQVMDLPEASHPAARALGKAMQFINFIRDIDEDLGLGRVYFPEEDLAAFGLHSLDPEEARARPQAFARFIALEMDRYLALQGEAEAGFGFIPPRLRIAVKTASDMYRWTADEIRRHPLVVYERKVKPSRGRIVVRACAAALAATGDPE
jgi:phytoene synthase